MLPDILIRFVKIEHEEGVLVKPKKIEVAVGSFRALLGWFSSCNRFNSNWRWYNGVAVLSFFSERLT